MILNVEERIDLGKVIIDSSSSVKEILDSRIIIKVKSGQSLSFWFQYKFEEKTRSYLRCFIDQILISYIDPLTGKENNFQSPRDMHYQLRKGS